MSDEKCGTCDGCGRIANDDDHTPWTFWENLPLKNAAAVLIGLVRPIPCPDCGGSGKRKQTVQVSVQLWRDGVRMGTVQLETNVGATDQEILEGLQESFGDVGGFEVRRKS